MGIKHRASTFLFIERVMEQVGMLVPCFDVSVRLVYYTSGNKMSLNTKKRLQKNDIPML